jgi:hypothetical protein
MGMSARDHPQTDGRTEIANGVLEDTLRRVVGPYQSSWDDHLVVAELAMNNSFNASIQETPFMLNDGQASLDFCLAFATRT